MFSNYNPTPQLYATTGSMRNHSLFKAKDVVELGAIGSIFTYGSYLHLLAHLKHFYHTRQDVNREQLGSALQVVAATLATVYGSKKAWDLISDVGPQPTTFYQYR